MGNGSNAKKKRKNPHKFRCSRILGGNLPRHAAVDVIEDVGAGRAQVLLDDDQAVGAAQGRLAPLQIPHQLLVRQVAHAPLGPDELVLDVVGRRPLLQADVEDAAHPGLALQTGGELGDGLDHVDLFGDSQEQPLGDPADPISACSP